MKPTFPDFKTVGDVFKEYTHPSTSNPYRDYRWKDMSISKEDLSVTGGGITMMVIRSVDELAQWLVYFDDYGFNDAARGVVSYIEIRDGLLVEPILAVHSCSSEESYLTYARWSTLANKVKDHPNV